MQYHEQNKECYNILLILSVVWAQNTMPIISYVSLVWPHLEYATPVLDP